MDDATNARKGRFGLPGLILFVSGFLGGLAVMPLFTLTDSAPFGLAIMIAFPVLGGLFARHIVLQRGLRPSVGAVLLPVWQGIVFLYVLMTVLALEAEAVASMGYSWRESFFKPESFFPAVLGRLFRPGKTLDSLQSILPYGCFSIAGIVPKGFSLVLFGLIYAALALLIPLLFVLASFHTLWDDEAGLYLTREESFPVEYREDFKSLRLALKDDGVAESFLPTLSLKPREKGESYALVTLYRHGKTVGRFFSFWNVKVYGPNGRYRRYTALARVREVSREAAAELYERLLAEKKRLKEQMKEKPDETELFEEIEARLEEEKAVTEKTVPEPAMPEEAASPDNQEGIMPANAEAEKPAESEEEIGE